MFLLVAGLSVLVDVWVEEIGVLVVLFAGVASQDFLLVFFFQIKNDFFFEIYPLGFFFG